MKRLLATLIIVIMLISQLAIVVNASQVEGLTEKTKITSQLKEKMDSAEEGEYIPIYIWLNSHDDFVVYEALSRTYSERINADNEQMLIDGRTQRSLEELKAEVTKVDKEESQDSTYTKFDEKKKRIKENTELGSKLSDSQIERFLENDDEQREIVANVEQTQYISEWRSARYNINQFINKEFEKCLNMEKCRNVNLDIQLAFVELETTTDYIYELEKLDMVESIGLLLSEKGTVYDEEAHNRAETDATASNSPYFHMTSDNVGYGNDGYGIKIGVIEFPDDAYKDLIYEINYRDIEPHLKNQNIIRNTTLWLEHEDKHNNRPSQHATTVLSILVGKEVALGQNAVVDGTQIGAGTVYQGLVPDAEIYYACYDIFDKETTVQYRGLKKAIYWCINNDVSVINMSLSAGTSKVYDHMDQYLDCIVTQYRVSIVKSSGNDATENEVTTPGIAYNVITVGNMTLSTDVDGNYMLNESSCYVEENYLPNKPDICAFGTNINMITVGGNVVETKTVSIMITKSQANGTVTIEDN